MSKTKIEWTNETDNIIVAKDGGWWCRKCSPGCEHCYAEALNRNAFFHGNGRDYVGHPPKLRLREDIFATWSNQRKPRRHFISSMTDVFGGWVPRSWIFRFLDAMASTPRQTFQVLTKRADQMAEHVAAWLDARGADRIPLNIWLGFTAENQECFDRRWNCIEPLVHRLGVVFVSAEPLLGAITLPENFLALKWRAQVIAGGESGDQARPMHPDWARGLRDQCHEAEVCFFFKQWGEWIAGDHVDGLPEHEPKRICKLALDGTQANDVTMPYEKRNGMKTVVLIGKKITGRILDDCTWQQMPYAHSICRVCGCSEFQACPSGRYWIDEEHTLCSECAPGTRLGPAPAISGLTDALRKAGVL